MLFIYCLHIAYIMITDYIDPLYVLLSFLVGVFMVYLQNRKLSKIVTVYPTPYNVEKFRFEDNIGNCYKLDLKAVTCPSDPTKIIKVKPVI